MLKNAVVRAESVDAAIQKGLEQLSIRQDQAEIRVISEGKKGFLGFGKQEAVVSITSQSDLSMKEMTQQLEKETGRPNKPLKKVESPKPSKTADYIKQNNEEMTDAVQLDQESMNPPLEGEAQDYELDQEAVKPLQNQGSSDPKSAQAVENQAELVIEEDVHSKDKPELIDQEVTHSQEPVASVEKASYQVEEQVASAVEDYPEFDEVCQYLEAVIREYGAESKVHYVADDHQVIFNIETDKSGLVIGKHGRIINSLQTLVQTLIHRRNRRRLSVLLNVGDYRDRRLNILEQMAQRTAEEVIRTKQTMILDPLPAYERKQIHAYLSKVDHISTHSEGKDPNRYLVVDYEA